MRVVHFGYADLQPGAARASYRLHRSMLDAGADSVMVVGRKDSDDVTVHGPSGKPGHWWVRRAPLVDYLPLRVLQPGRPEVSTGWVGSRRLPDVYRLDPALVQLHWVAGGLIRPPALGRLPDVPVVWRLADMWPFTGIQHYAAPDGRWSRVPAPRGRSKSGEIVEAWALGRKRRAYRKIRDLTIVTPSRWLAGEATRSLAFAGRRVEVIATGVDVEAWKPLPREEARAALGLPEGPIILFGAHGGEANPRKGWRQLVEAVRFLAGEWRGPRPLLAVFGTEGPADDERLPFEVRRLGRITDEAVMRRAFAAADVFVAPSLAENLANTVLEALACGAPCVAFDIGGMPDAVDHLHNGYLAHPGDATDLAAGITYVLGAGRDAQAALRASARRSATERFDGRRQARRYLELYAELVDGQPISAYPGC